MRYVEVLLTSMSIVLKHHASTVLQRYHKRCTIINILILLISFSCDTIQSSDSSARSFDNVILRIGDAIQLVDRGKPTT
ncbi:MAG TPA: hypothetical protein DIS79_08740, partial [Bacteroidetes bacterium]|nr:hypothetical protein [Bacteroidota bacterium]